MTTDTPWLLAPVLLLAAAGMTVANWKALREDRLRRLMVYGSIAHAGYLLVGLSVALAAGCRPMCWDGLASALFYLIVYALAALGAFAAIACLVPFPVHELRSSLREVSQNPSRDREGAVQHVTDVMETAPCRLGRRVEYLDELAGLARSRPVVAASLAACLLSLAGTPPLAGFWGKLAVLAGALEIGLAPDCGTAARVGFVALAVAGTVNAALAAVYYVRIVGVIYCRLPLAECRAEGGRAARTVAVVCAAAVVVIGLSAGPLWRWTLEASRSVSAEAARESAPLAHGAAARTSSVLWLSNASGRPNWSACSTRSTGRSTCWTTN